MTTTPVYHMPIVVHLLLSLCFQLAMGTVEAALKGPPNIVFILADDLGFDDIGYHNKLYDNVLRTPNLDRLAEQGVKLESYYVQALCSPSRAALLSGRYPIHTGLQHSIIQSGVDAALLPLYEIIPEKLKRYGYTSHMVGKWHLGYARKKYTPTHRGFDSFFGYWIGAENYYSHTNRCNFPGWECQGPTTCWGIDYHDNDDHYDGWHEYSTYGFTSRAVKVIRDHANSSSRKPLFLYVAYQAVHGPLQAPQEIIDKYSNIKDHDRRVYAAMLELLDEGVGNITQALKDIGMLDNTIIMFSTDNGGHVKVGANNWPLRGWKASYWEGGIRGVGFVYSPLLPSSQWGTSRTGLMHITDWLPTIMGLARCSSSSGGGDDGGREEEDGLDGFDQWPMIAYDKPSNRNEILNNIDPMGLDEDPWGGTKQAIIRVGRYKLLQGHPGQNLWHDGWVPPPGYDVTSDPNRIPWSQRDDDEEGCLPCHFTYENLTSGICVFDIEDDPYERCNLAPNNPQLVASLLTTLSHYNATAIPPLYPPPSPLCDPSLYHNRFVSWADGMDDRHDDEIKKRGLMMTRREVKEQRRKREVVGATSATFDL